ncbi:hypothetical protein AVEN_112855-1 [Araneus ventricosus]|uniref:Uncharacterized protein n=1 Tax=Araneus ventricosus TaxID=182803 RepID=A0A4Y2HTX0_ARAVE|nr:hypothetical protein AVEN_112855-1 [Araneus ventricosus]
MSAKEFISIDDDILTDVPIGNVSDIIERHTSNDSSDDDEYDEDCTGTDTPCPNFYTMSAGGDGTLTDLTYTKWAYTVAESGKQNTRGLFRSVRHAASVSLNSVQMTKTAPEPTLPVQTSTPCQREEVGA